MLHSRACRLATGLTAGLLLSASAPAAPNAPVFAPPASGVPVPEDAGSGDAVTDLDLPSPLLDDQRPGVPEITAPGLDPALLDLALTSLACARREGVADGPQAEKILSIIDFRLPSTARRLWVLDLEHASTLFVERVAHGRTTGEDVASHFSNVPHSNASSVGLFRTGETYTGQHGRSLRLDGLEPGFNDAARARGIVVHAAEYCTPEHVDTYGRLGRSQGCPALDPAVSTAVIDTIRDGTLLFAYYPESDWLEKSRFMHC